MKTRITDGNGTRCVDIPQRKCRAPAKPRRFANVKVGDWLTGGPYAKGLDFHGRKGAPRYFLVTDHWFDPVAGQRDPESGMMYAVAMLLGLDRETGEPRFQSKYAHTRRALASQGYHYSDIPDPVALLKATKDGIKEGTVTPFRKVKKSQGPRPL